MYFSHAEWSKLDYTTQDIHDTRKQAEGVCRLMIDRWGKHSIPCEVRGTCIRTWVTPEKSEEE